MQPIKKLGQGDARKRGVLIFAALAHGAREQAKVLHPVFKRASVEVVEGGLRVGEIGVARRGHQPVVIHYGHFVLKFGIRGPPDFVSMQIKLVADVDVGVVEPEIRAESANRAKSGRPDQRAAVDGEGLAIRNAGSGIWIGAMSIEEVPPRGDDPGSRRAQWEPRWRFRGARPGPCSIAAWLRGKER